jgi:hypothetical protein
LAARKTAEQNESETGDIKAQSCKPANAYQAYQLSRLHFHQLMPLYLNRSRVLLEEAVPLDPDYALAYAALAEQSIQEVIVGLHAPAENFPKAKEAIRQAFELNTNSAEFCAAASLVDLICDWNFTGAEWNLRKALQLNPYSRLCQQLSRTGFNVPAPDGRSRNLFTAGGGNRADGSEYRHCFDNLLFSGAKLSKDDRKKRKLLAVYPRFVVAAWMRCWALEQTSRAAEALVEYKKSCASRLANLPGDGSATPTRSSATGKTRLIQPRASTPKDASITFRRLTRRSFTRR